MTNVAVSNSLIKGMGPFEASRVSLIQFADNTFFFCEARKRYMRNLIFVWRLFEWASGLKVNREKSEKQLD